MPPRTPAPRSQVIRQFMAARGRLLNLSSLPASDAALVWDQAFAITQEERDKGADSGAAMPDGSFLITTCDGEASVDNAVHAVGRGNADHDAIRRHIMKRADELGCATKIPDNWNKDGSISDVSAAMGDPVSDTSTTPDTEISNGVATLKSTLDAIQKAQAADPDASSDPNDAKVQAAIETLSQAITALDEAQQADVAGEDESDDVDATPGLNEEIDDGPVSAKLAAKDDIESLNPNDTEGNVDPDAVCATPGCGHMASLHENTETGDNTGACTTPDCACTQMTFASSQGDQPINAGDGGTGDDGGGVNNAGGSDAKMGIELAPVPDVPGASPAGDVTSGSVNLAPADPTINQAPAIEGTTTGRAFVIPCGIIEGQSTMDGRGLGTGSLEWLNPPLPLMGQVTQTHDPSGMDPNDPAVLCGYISSVERVPGESGTQLIKATGYFLDDEDGAYYADKVAQMGRIGVSADIMVTETTINVQGVDEFGFPEDMTEVVTKGILQGFTIVPGPAFPQCYITIEGQEPTEPVPVQAEGMVASQIVHFMVERPCQPCAEMEVVNEAEALVAGAFVDAPLRPPLAWFSDPHFTQDDPRMVEVYSGRGERRLGHKVCPFTVTDEGEVYGHIAPWGVCHTGYAGECVTAPSSKRGYADFMRSNQVVVTAEGQKVNVGVLTFNTNHASLSRNLRASDAQSHYDHTGAAFADVVSGEDEFGIWVHGALRPTVREEDLRAIRAASPSGDWREIGGHLELVAVLMVNQPGFPATLVADGSAKALVAAGALTMERAAKPVEEVVEGDALAAVAPTLLRLAADDSRRRLRALERQDALRRLSRL